MIIIMAITDTMENKDIMGITRIMDTTVITVADTTKNSRL